MAHLLWSCMKISILYTGTYQGAQYMQLSLKE